MRKVLNFPTDWNSDIHEKLWLYNNQLTGSIPPEVGNLTNLTNLFLDGNQLTGSNRLGPLCLESWGDCIWLVFSPNLKEA